MITIAQGYVAATQPSTPLPSPTTSEQSNTAPVKGIRRRTKAATHENPAARHQAAGSK